MDYVVTFSDVMAWVVACAIGVLGFFIKSWFNGLKKDMDSIRGQIAENDRKVNLRVEKLEDRTNAEIENIKNNLGEIRGEFATVFVQREDFFRSMNGVEDAIRVMDGKVDRILMNSSERKG